MEHDGPAVLVEGLTKAFGGVRALQGVDLAIARGTVLGLLGPNGSGKTTTVRILTTLLPPDGGRAVIEGIDVFRHPEAVRAIIGLAGQQASVDETLTGRENLELAARLFHLSRKEARRRADELLERLGLADAGNRPAKTYSGGMRRRLDLGASLVGRPKVLFLDEPTTGLDPRSRLDLWDLIRDLVQDGTTLLLTTQYLEEADQLAHEIAVIDHGKVIASGTPDQLKDRIGGDVLELRVLRSSQLDDAVRAIETLGSAPLETDRSTGTVIVPVGSQGSEALIEAVRRLDSAGVAVADLALRRPSLDTVFLALTGHGAEDEAAAEPRARRSRRRTASAPSR
jgi:ABC-2 type transport system ATP-binding protein